MGGSDQWGNILSGKELIRRLDGGRSEGITFPLLLTSTGKKFGKTEEGAVWLDGQRTSPYQMYQYWLQTADADVVRYLKLFTFLPQQEIEDLAAQTVASPEQRRGQKVLAAECTGIIHTREAVAAVEAASRILFDASHEVPSEQTLEMLAREVPVAEIGRVDLEAGVPLVGLLVQSKLAESKGAARKLIEGGGVYVNNVRVSEVSKAIRAEDVRWPGALLLRAGKKNHCVVMVK
jgi:tyrosyl-tRNA synthetase